MSSRPALVHRRSSVTASDRYGQHVAHDGHSTITIFRPDHPQQQQSHGSHRRHASVERPSSPRLSFANASFGKASPPPSPTIPRRASMHSRPSPEQLLALARSSAAHPSDTVAVFTPLPDNILLPFIDRPSEVAALIASSPTSRLLSLLSKTLPASSASPTSPDDPTQWTFSDLTAYLTTPDRDTDPDDLWVSRIKAAVFPHSELIWERLKAALGVPPELDGDMHPATLEDSSSDVFLDSPVIDPSSGRSRSSSVNSKGASNHGGDDLSLANLGPPFGPDLSISPLLSPSTSAPLHSPTADPNHLAGISEESEMAETDDAPRADFDLYTPTQIHGIRIATRSSSFSSPLPSPNLSKLHQQPISQFPPLSPVSPLPPYNPKVASHPPSSPHLAPGRRSSSFGYERARPRLSSPLSSGLRPSTSSPRIGDGPMFPSNFARLAYNPASASNSSVRPSRFFIPADTRAGQIVDVPKVVDSNTTSSPGKDSNP